MNVTFSLKLLLVIAFGGAFLTYFLGKILSVLRELFAIIVSCAVVFFVAYLYNQNIKEVFYVGFFNYPLVIRLNMLSWFFAIAVSALGLLSVVFSLSYMKSRERLDFYYLMMLLVNASMLGIVLAGDLISFYIFWEVMSWITFLLISYNKKSALDAGIKYIVMSIIGSATWLVAMFSLYVNFNTFDISAIAQQLSHASSTYVLFILILLGITFGIKNAVMPLHTWLPDAYAEAPSPFTAVLSGMLTRMGVYGFLILMYVLVGLNRVIVNRLLSFHFILAWLGAITIVIPTFIAMLQNDAKKLLAWHGIGQGGYMIVGIAVGTPLAVAGGIFHTLNHAIYIVLLFMSVGAVQYRTGVRDLNMLGGLIKKLPIAFVGALFGISGLIGIPLTNGFVSKWLIYKALIINQHPFLAFAALIGTWGTILSVYKFIHNMFLGQLPEEYRDIDSSPFSMKLPMLILSFTILLFGVLPGIPLKVISAIESSFGFKPLQVSIWGIGSEAGVLSTINIFAAFIIAGIVSLLFFSIGKRSIKVEQEDTYAAGFHVPKGRYQYSAEFYNPFYRIATPYLKDFADSFYRLLGKGTGLFSNGIRRLYTGDIGYYVIYIILFLAVLILIKVGLKPW